MEPSKTSDAPHLSIVDAMLLEAEAQLSNNNNNATYRRRNRDVEGASMRVLSNGAVEETSAVYDEQEGTKQHEFIDDAALKHYRELVQLLDYANSMELRKQGSTHHTASTMVNINVMLSSTTQNHLCIIDSKKKGKS